MDNKLFTVTVCVLALFAGIFLMRWFGGKTGSSKTRGGKSK